MDIPKPHARGSFRFTFQGDQRLYKSKGPESDFIFQNRERVRKIATLGTALVENKISIDRFHYHVLKKSTLFRLAGSVLSTCNFKHLGVKLKTVF